MDVRGVRNSCEASDRKLRSRSSDRARWANAVSIWASIPLRARPRRAISPSPSVGSTRRVRSPAAMASASLAMASKGRRPWRITRVMRASRATRSPSDTARSMVRRESRVALTVVSEVATTRMSPWTDTACRRYWGPPVPCERTVIEPDDGR
jgi:hypothetical protein